MLYMKNNGTLLYLLIITCFLTACGANKRLTQQSQYFRNLNDSILQKASQEYEPIFQKGDILSIAVITPNEMSSRLFNQPNFSNGSSNATADDNPGTGKTIPGGYLIDEKGTIVFPLLGQIPANGLTRQQLTDIISNKLKLYIDSAIVSVRLLNYRITVLGEVVRSGTFSIPSERVTILDAIGLAGDLTIYGKRNNIRVIRTVNGTRQTGTINLNNGDIFSSPYFYLRQNDIVYVEMNERKIPNTDQASLRNVSIALGIVSALGVIISTINVLK
jgi:polysaccharide biosynthesis/export protein